MFSDFFEAWSVVQTHDNDIFCSKLRITIYIFFNVCVEFADVELCLRKGFHGNFLCLVCACAKDPGGLGPPLETPELLEYVETEPLFPPFGKFPCAMVEHDDGCKWSYNNNSRIYNFYLRTNL